MKNRLCEERREKMRTISLNPAAYGKHFLGIITYCAASNGCKMSGLIIFSGPEADISKLFLLMVANNFNREDTTLMKDNGIATIAVTIPYNIVGKNISGLFEDVRVATKFKVKDIPVLTISGEDEQLWDFFQDVLIEARRILMNVKKVLENNPHDVEARQTHAHIHVGLNNFTSPPIPVA
jgi:hypothetical protein